MDMKQTNSEAPPRVLLVDDEPHNLFLLQETLKAYDFDMAEARDGQQAIRYIREEQPDLVLLDIIMPVMDGLSTCKALKTFPETASIPIIFLTGQDDINSKIQAFNLGCVDYITKPFLTQEVIIRVASHLGHTRIIKNMEHRLREQQGIDAEVSVGPTLINQSPARQAQLVADACDILLSEMQSPPKLDRLARQLKTNRDYLNTAFRTALGTTPFAWLREERLHLAARLLDQTDKALKQIAYQCGYSSPASFITSFKQRFGMTPHEFRHQDD